MSTNGIRPPPITLMVLLLFSTQACTDIFLSGLPLIAQEFGVSMGVSNLTISVYNYSQAFFVLFIGVVSDLWGRLLLSFTVCSYISPPQSGSRYVLPCQP